MSSEKLSISEKLRLSRALLRGVKALRRIIGSNPAEDPFADCEALVSEAAPIAKKLGFRNPPLWAETYWERDGHKGLCREIHIFYPTRRGKIFILAPYSSPERHKELLAEAQQMAIHSLDRWELFLKLILQSLKERRDWESQQSVERKPGRKSNPAQRQRDAWIFEKWQIAKAAGVAKKDFAEQEGIAFKELERLLEREAQRRRRAQR